MFNAFRAVFSVTSFIGRRSRKTRLFALVCGLPVLAAAVIQSGHLFFGAAGIDGASIFGGAILAFDLQFLILILALFYGTSVCSDEVENKTLTYLTTRPVPKPVIILGKYAAYAALLIGLVAASVLLSFVILSFDQLADVGAWLRMLGSLGVLALGLACYLAFFTLVGTFLKKSILFGLAFSFGWENIVQYFPGSTQKFTIMHYLKSLLPVGSSDSGALAFLVFRLEPSRPLAAAAMLAALTAAFLGAACLVFSKKEYLFDQQA
jgi:ABC-2 type transport system permease protein